MGVADSEAGTSRMGASGYMSHRKQKQNKSGKRRETREEGGEARYALQGG